MSGHSKWSTIKHQKGVADARRGQLFTKLAKEIIVAAREGGGDPDLNPRLRLAVQKAKDNSMPADNIERAIKKGTGDLEGVTLEELVLEGYGVGGAAVLVKALTDNRNRTIQEVRHLFSKHGGNLGENGSVSWIFDSKGVIVVRAEGLDTEELALEAIDAGADDVQVEGAVVEIYTMPEDMEAVRKVLEAKKVHIASAELCLIPKNQVALDDKAAAQVLRLLEKLEEMDEIQQVASNADFTDSALEKYKSEAKA